MYMDRIIMWILACCAFFGGIDRIFGNRFGLGDKFEAGFHLLGPTALSMAGIICLVPLLSHVLGGISGICTALGIDPAIFGGFIAIDMGGYQLAAELASDVRLGSYAGVIIAATLGCTISFTIPIGMGTLHENTRNDFARGILYGLIALPVSLLTGGLMCGLRMSEIIRNSLPVFLISLIVLWGIWKKTGLTIRVFCIFAKCISILCTVGLMLGAFAYMTGVSPIPGLAPIEDAMAVVASISVVMLGSLPMAEILQRILRRPMKTLCSRTGLNQASSAGLLIGMVSVMPAIVLVKDMDRRGRSVNAAFMVCAASAFAAHLGFTAGVNRQMIPAMLVSKLAGGCIGAIIAYLACKRDSSDEIL